MIKMSNLLIILCPRTEAATPWKGLGSVSYFKRGVESCILLPLWGPGSHWCRAAKWLAEKKRYIVNNWLRMRAEFKLTIRLRTFTPDGKGQLTRYQGIIIRQQTFIDHYHHQGIKTFKAITL